MDAPLLSVCLITYNHHKYIKEAIDGVLMQRVDFTFELIIADDFSTDGTREIILEYKNKYPDLIRLIFQEKNVGAAQNWTDLIDTPESKYIAYFEGDDYWTDPLKLQKQIDFLEHNDDFSICTHNVFIYNEGLQKFQGEWLGGEHQEISTLENLLQNGSGGATCSLVFRNKIYGNIPDWYYNIKGGDWTLQILCTKYGKMRYFREVMGVYRVNHDNSSLNVAMREASMENKETIGVAYKNTLHAVDILDKAFNNKYSSYLRNQKIYALYESAVAFHNNRKYKESQVYARNALDEISKSLPYLSNERIKNLIYFSKEKKESIKYIKRVKFILKKLLKFSIGRFK